MVLNSGFYLQEVGMDFFGFFNMGSSTPSPANTSSLANTPVSTLKSNVMKLLGKKETSFYGNSENKKQALDHKAALIEASNNQKDGFTPEQLNELLQTPVNGFTITQHLDKFEKPPTGGGRHRKAKSCNRKMKRKQSRRNRA